MPDGFDATSNSTHRAVHLCANQAGLLAMTPRQRAVFLAFGRQQIEDGGPHSLLPQVMDAFYVLAQHRPDPPTRPLVDVPADPDHRRDLASISAMIAKDLCLSRAGDVAPTPAQHERFDALCAAQVADAGPGSLLPQVVHALLRVARAPWWDRAPAVPSDRHDQPRPGLPA